MLQCRDALVDWLKSVFPDTWHVTYYVPVTRLEAALPVQRQIMGDPVRFVSVDYVPSLDRREPTGVRGQGIFPVFRFEVHVYLAYRDADTYENSSMKEWDDVLWGSVGLLRRLTDVVVHQYLGESYVMEGISASRDLVALDARGRYSHHLELVVGVSRS